MDENLLKQVFDKIDSYREYSVELQRAITAIPALSPVSGGDGEWKKALRLKEEMDRIGYDSRIDYNAPAPGVPEGTRPNYVYKMLGKDKERTLWIMSHIDIVPPGDAKMWNSDPYKLKTEGDYIYGRGVEDNQQGIVASMLMFKALRELNIEPSINIGLMFVSDEETGSEYGIKHVLDANPEIFKKNDLIYVPDSGSEDGSQVEIAEKSIMWLKFSTSGKQTHASRPADGINAFRAASNLVVRLQMLYEIFAENNLLFDPPISTFEPTKKEANVPNVNTVPGEDVFYLDCRILPSYNLDDIVGEVRKITDGVEKDYNVKINIEFVQREQAAPATSADADVVTAVSAAIRKVYGSEPKPVGIGGGTVAAHIRRKNLPVVVWATLNDMAHQANESCLISNMLGDAKVFAHIALQ